MAGDGGYIITFLNLANPVAEAGDVVEVTVLDKAGKPFTQEKQNLTEADVKAFGVAIDIKTESSKSASPWDVNDDGQVDISDLVLVGKHFGESTESPQMQSRHRFR